MINLPGRSNGNIGSRQVISFPQNGGSNNGGRPVVVNQNGNNSGGRRGINQNSRNNPSNASGRENGRGRRNIGNVNVEQGRRTIERQPQIQRNTQIQQRAPQIRRQVIQAPRQFSQLRVSSGSGGRR